MTRFLLIAVCLIAFVGSEASAAEARLILRGRVKLSGDLPSYNEDSVNFYGTQVYLLESGMLRRRIEEAAGHAAPAELKITAERVPNTSIILVTASASDEAAAKSFLDSLVDEFLKYKREQRKRAFADAIARLEVALRASRDAAPELQKLKQQLAAASVLDSEPEFEKLPEK